MASSDAALAIYLDSPLQSWGCGSKFQQRGTESHPTKSGVVGMFCAAAGATRGSEREREIISALSGSKFSVWEVSSKNTGGASTRIEDFHTIGGGYNREDPADKLRISQKADGGVGETVVTRRDYLAQAKFIAVITGETETVKKISDTLEDPAWGIWFGRKSCIPASPLLPTVGRDMKEALSTILGRLESEVGPRVVQDDETIGGGGGWRQNDEPVSYLERTFHTRKVCKA